MLTRLDASKVQEEPGPVQASGAGEGGLESGGGDKTKPFVQSAVTVQDEDVGSSAPPRPAASAAPAGTPQSDGGLVSEKKNRVPLRFFFFSVFLFVDRLLLCRVRAFDAQQ